MRQLIFILLAIIGVSQAQTIQYIGAPTTTVISRGNFRTDSIFYLPKRTKLPTDTAALRYQISDSSLYAWTGSQWRKVGADADTLVYSTRAWRQKGDDSLAARINLKVNISDTASMLTPYLRKSDTTAMLSPYYRSAAASAALALKLNISDTSSMLGNYIRHAGYGLTKSGQSFLVDTLNIATRAWRQKGLDSLAEIRIAGSGTTNYVPKFTATRTLGNSNIFDDGSGVGIYVTPNRWFASRKPLEVTSAGTIAGVAGAGLGFLEIWGNSYLDTNVTSRYIISGSAARYALGNNASGGSSHTFFTAPSGSAGGSASFTAALNIFSNSRVAVNATLDAGYQFDVNGTMRSVNGANFATTTGNVGIGTTTTTEKLHVVGNVLATEAAGTYPRFISTVGSKSWEIGYRSFTTNYELREDDTTRLVVANGGSVGVNTGTPNASAVLDVTSTTQGFLPPRMTTAQRDAISSPAAGLVIYNTTTSKLQVYTTAWTDLH